MPEFTNIVPSWVIEALGDAFANVNSVSPDVDKFKLSITIVLI